MSKVQVLIRMESRSLITASWPTTQTKETGSSSGDGAARVGKGRQRNACVLTQQPTPPVSSAAAETREANTSGCFLLFVFCQVYRPEVSICALAPGPPRFKDNVAYLCVAASWMSAVVTEAFIPAEITVPVFHSTLC